MRPATRLNIVTDPAADAEEKPNLALAPKPGVAPQASLAPAQSAEAPILRVAAWLRSALPKLLMTTLSLGMFIAFWYFATKYKLDFYIRFNNIPSPGEVWDNAAYLAQW